MSQDLTKGSLAANIKKMAIPASIGFFFNTMYNVVDTYYAGLLSTDVLAALSISFPVFFIILAFGSGISTAGSALISNYLGSKRKDKAKLYSAQIISFGLIFSIFLTILGYYLAKPLFMILGAEGEYLNVALDYMYIIIAGAIFFIMVNVLNSILVSSGNSKTYRNFLILGFVLNLILDPWFMFGGLGVPAMGVKGIAFATILIMAIGVIFIGSKAIKTGLIDRSCFSCLKPQKKAYKNIIKQGFPASLNMMTVAIGIFIITYFLSKFGSEAVASYGVITRIEQIALLPTIGLNVAALAIVGQNNGAKKHDRVKRTLSITMKYGNIIMSIGAFFLLFFPYQLMNFFTDSEVVIGYGVTALRIAAITSWSYVVLTLCISVLQGLKKPMYAIYIGLTRQIILPFIVFTIALNYGITAIWWSIFAINWIAALFTLLYTKKELAKIS